MKRFHLFSSLVLFCLFVAATAFAGPKDPISGESFELIKKHQNIELQNALRSLLTEDRGYIVFGTLDPRVKNEKFVKYYQTVRVVCPDTESQKSAGELLNASPNFTIKKSVSTVEKPDEKTFPGYRGIVVELELNGTPYTIQLQTLQQLRFMIWAKNYLIEPKNPDIIRNLNEYAFAVSQYLYLIDILKLDAHGPKATEYKLPESFDLYANPPDYVIQGYQNYKDYLRSHAEIVTNFTRGVLGFVPTTATLENLKNNAPQIAYPNKERELLQEEFKKFVERGGSMSSMKTMTKEIFEALEPGEYFFAVGMNGNIRFGRELTREEVAKIEETGKKPARANHAFLFPGEPIMTGGAFFIGCKGPGHLEAVNTQSGHYFYSNITSTIKEDIAERSDSYFITIGHLLNAFDNLGINYESAVISKL